MSIKPGFYQWYKARRADGSPIFMGTLVVTERGLDVDPDDGFYGGTLDPEEAVKLAREILDKHEKKT